MLRLSAQLKRDENCKPRLRLPIGPRLPSEHQTDIELGTDWIVPYRWFNP